MKNGLVIGGVVVVLAALGIGAAVLLSRAPSQQPQQPMPQPAAPASSGGGESALDWVKAIGGIASGLAQAGASAYGSYTQSGGGFGGGDD